MSTDHEDAHPEGVSPAEPGAEDLSAVPDSAAPDGVLLVVGETGGTRTRALLLKVAGPRVTRIASGVSTGANPNTVGWAAAVSAWHSALLPVAQALDGRSPDATTYSCSGEPDPALAAHDAVLGSGLPRPVCLSDLQAPLHAATADLTGTVLVAGTGAKAVAFAGGEPVRQAGGWGWFLGGGGSGPWIGKRILRAGLSDLDAGLRTPLTAAIADVLGIDETLTHRHVLDHVYAELTRVPGAAGMLAPLVDQVDDPRIAAIKLKAAKHLARLLGSVHSGGPVILAGTVASGPIGQAAAARAGLAAVAEADGLTGAAVHAAATAGLAMSAALTAALRTATARTNPGTNPGT